MGVTVSDKFSAEKAKNFFNKADSLVKNTNKTSYHHLIKADALRIKNYFWEAIDEYLTAIKYDEQNIEAFIGLGLAYKQVGFAKSAIAAFNKAKKLDYFDKQLYFEAGCCYCIDQKFLLAVKEYKKALKLNPAFLEAKFNLALTYELNKQNTLAIKKYKEIILENPEHIKSYDKLGSLYMKLDIYKPAVKIFRKLIKLEPNNERGILGIAICFDKLKENKKALRYYRKYLKNNPNSGSLAYILERVDELKKENLSAKNCHLRLVS